MRTVPYLKLIGYRYTFHYGIDLLTNETNMINVHSVSYGVFKASNHIVFFGIIHPLIRPIAQIKITSLNSQVAETHTLEDLYSNNILLSFNDNDKLFTCPTDTFLGENIRIDIDCPRNADLNHIFRISSPLFLSV